MTSRELARNCAEDNSSVPLARPCIALRQTSLPRLATAKIFLRFAQGFLKRSVGHLYVHDEQTALNSTSVFIQRLQGAISFSNTTRGNRQRRAWERLINYIGSSASLCEFDNAAARAEGYAQALVDGEQIDTHATDRDLLIIATVDAWRRHLIQSNLPASL